MHTFKHINFTGWGREGLLKKSFGKLGCFDRLMDMSVFHSPGAAADGASDAGPGAWEGPFHHRLCAQLGRWR